MDRIDLHVHSNRSDGTFSPAQLVELALQKGLRAFALTDHDTVAGIAEAMDAAAGTSVEVVPGIEFSTRYLEKEIHIVGLDFDWKSPAFAERLRHFQDSRSVRNEIMIQKLQHDGFDISMEQMQEAFGDAVCTRAHIARYLADQGYVSEIPEAFARLIGEGCPYYVPREKVTPMQAVRLIFQCGGIPVLAHPMLYHLAPDDMDTLLRELKKAGLMGIEALYSTHSAADENLVRLMAKQHGLLISGGSDFHGANKPDIELGTGRGNLRIPGHILTNLRDRRDHA